MPRHALARKPNGNVKTPYFPLKGGLNLVDAPLAISDGMVLGAINYELLSRDGYRRVDGIERFDGQSSPSEASYWILNFDAGTAIISEGDIVTGATSGHTAKALVDAVITSGSYGGSDAAGYLVVTNATGVFQDNESLQVSSVTKSTADGTAVKRGAATPAEDATHAQDAIETQRALILKVGVSDASGSVRGVHEYNGDVYGFRDNAAGTECLMWKATSTGWVQQSLGNRIPFTDGGAGVAYVESEVITGTTSGASATINRVVLQSGTWGTDAKGYFIVGTVTAGPFQAEATTGSIAGAVPIDSAEIANTFLPGGRFEFENYNFFGTSGSFRMYGVDGVNPAFEWDGTVFVPILTGNTNDNPTHLAINEYHLMLCFEKGSLQNSSTGLPYRWAGLGAAEIGTGDELIGLIKEVGSALIVICRNRTFALFGKNTTASPWDLRTISDKSGGIEWTLQRIGVTRWLDDRGFTKLSAVQAYGDFKDSVYSQLIEPLILEKKNNVTASLIVKNKNHLRTFFDDGTGVIATFSDNKLSGFTQFRYIDSGGLSIVANCTNNGEDSNGSERIFMGATDGYVYQIDKGTSFDGGTVSSTLILNYSHLGSPSYNKQFKKAVLEADGSAGTNIEYTALFNYSLGNEPVGITLDQTLTTSGSYWNNAIWDSFNWASEDVSQIEGNIDGVGFNISLQIASTGIYVEPHTLYGVTYHYIPRKRVR